MPAPGPDPALVARFVADLDRVAAPGARLGIAVSGGPDSLALLLLAAKARPGSVEAATVDHRLRAEAAAEAAVVAALCARMGVAHATLAAEWEQTPATAIQERARTERYRLLAGWAADRGLDAVVTAHHRDDQAETLLMRLNRGSGVGGLGAIRPVSNVPGGELPLLRPLLGWRRSELEAVCASAGIEPALDPSNSDQRFERARVREALSSAGWLDIDAVARSADALAAADAALDWATEREWREQVRVSSREIAYRPSGPDEIRRRIVAAAVAELAVEGVANPLRGRELDRLVEALSQGGRATLRGVLCAGGEIWSFCRAPRRVA